MSSIYGKLNFNQKPIDYDALAAMETALNHWDADDKDIWYKDSVGLGHLMLYNTPESLHEKLPLYDSDSRLTITADARIDNRDELFSKLGLAKQEAHLITDSFLIMKTYEKYGENCVQHLVGDFAFAIWDEREQKLFCARDHMGIKPFFYYQDDKVFIFASEKKGILCAQNIDASINYDYLYTLLVSPTDQPAGKTLYMKINRLRPAHSLSVSPGRKAPRTTKYWTLDIYNEIKRPKYEDYCDELEYYFKTAVNCRLRSAYGIAAELSGGLDSSGVTCVASRLLQQRGKNLSVFSNTFAIQADANQTIITTERECVDAVIAQYNIIDFEYLTNTFWDNPIDEADFNLKVNDGPEMSDLLWQLPIKRRAMQKGLRTMLSGFGGDEMVTNRGRHFIVDLWHKRKYLEIARQIRKPKHPELMQLFLNDVFMERYIGLKYRFGYLSKPLNAVDEFYDIPRDVLINTHKSIKFSSDYYSERFKSYRHYLASIMLKTSVYNRFELETRYGLYYKIESRFPMADIRLIQFYLSIPNELKYGYNASRKLYKNSLKGYLPSLLYNKEDKTGPNAYYLKDWAAKRRAVVAEILRAMPPNKLIKPEAVDLKIKLLEQYPFGDKNPESYNSVRLRIPNLFILRWIEKNLCY